MLAACEVHAFEVLACQPVNSFLSLSVESLHTSPFVSFLSLELRDRQTTGIKAAFFSGRKNPFDNLVGATI